MYPIIVCIAKRESDYIEEWVKYHLHIGFKHIYLYDNEDTPTYQNVLKEYSDSITFIHFPGNSFHKGVQYVALDDFVNKYMYNNNITHVAHIDIDEFIVLKKHNNICEFINEYIVGDCGGIGMNWRFFGSSGHTVKTSNNVLSRFTKCQLKGDRHIKTIFDIKCFVRYDISHNIRIKPGFHIKSTLGNITDSPFNDNIDLSVIQVNHYKCKSLEEFKNIQSRGRVDLVNSPYENTPDKFSNFDFNDIEDTTALDKYNGI